MILNCNSCGKKFVVPDNAISASGRVVQCGSCGNKWKQFPLNQTSPVTSVSRGKKLAPKVTKIQQKTQKPKKIKKITTRKPREIDLYSPEYLAKKHGIKLKSEEKDKPLQNVKTSLGFYNSLLLYIVVIIFLSRALYFVQDFVVEKFPFSEFYINYFFESIRNMFEIWKNLISAY